MKNYFSVIRLNALTKNGYCLYQRNDVWNRDNYYMKKMSTGSKSGVAANQEQGIYYGWNKDYDNLESEQAVIDLLHNGKRSKYAKCAEKTE